jgi:hypothetical protein
LFSYTDRVLEGGSAVVASEDVDDIPFLDLFLGGDGAAQRLTVMQNAVSFAGLGRMQPRAAANMEALVGSWEDRFGRGRVDRRLVGMRLRARAACAARSGQRGFSSAARSRILAARGRRARSPGRAVRPLAFLTRPPA